MNIDYNISTSITAVTSSITVTAMMHSSTATANAMPARTRRNTGTSVNTPIMYLTTTVSTTASNIAVSSTAATTTTADENSMFSSKAYL